jgi:hypothetical protein
MKSETAIRNDMTTLLHVMVILINKKSETVYRLINLCDLDTGRNDQFQKGAAF